MVIPAVIFWYIEDGWTYLDSLYFAFVALMTIGFGDFVAGTLKTRQVYNLFQGLWNRFIKYTIYCELSLTHDVI